MPGSLTHKTLRLGATLRHLKPIQLYYRAYYLTRGRLRRLQGFRYPMQIPRKSHVLILAPGIPLPDSYQHGRFRFLNIDKQFPGMPDWNDGSHGKLWLYNLCYFDFLNQEHPSPDSLKLIKDFIARASTIRDGMEAFPISLRGINWIRFFVRENIRDAEADASLYAQYLILADKLEYHLLGNHLLENAFSLLFGAYYFNDAGLYKKAVALLSQELDEQVLPDGAHFELSPMYHCIMLSRLLDCCNLVMNNNLFGQELQSLLFRKAKRMLGWLQQMRFGDGSLPLFNDSARGIAPEAGQLLAYAGRLGIQPELIPLKESGYRKMQGSNYELVIDVGNIGPDYIPGHAHSDTFNFELQVDGRPLIVDSGLSTYENNPRRHWERGTAAHNTVQLDTLEQSEVWGSFRVGRRAKIVSLEEQPGLISASHDGYRAQGLIHNRQFSWNDKGFSITDLLPGNPGRKAFARLHIHPDARPVLEGNTLLVGRSRIILKFANSLRLSEYHYAPAFNTLKPAMVLTAGFSDRLETIFEL